MMNAFGKCITGLIEFNWNMAIALLGLSGGTTEIPRPDAPPPGVAEKGVDAPDEVRAGSSADAHTHADAAADPRAEATRSIMSYLEATNLGATVQEISTRLEMDRMSALPLLKTLVREGKVDEILGRYYAVNVQGGDQPPSKS